MPRSALAVSAPSTPQPSSSARRSTRASSSRARQTPLSPSSTLTAAHHPQTADELAAEEAARLLRLDGGPSKALRSRGSARQSPRDLRHRHLNEAREVLSPLAGRERKSSADGGDDEEDGEIAQASAILDGMVPGDEEDEDDSSPPPTAGRLEPLVRRTPTATRQSIIVPSQEPQTAEPERPAPVAEESESNVESAASSSSSSEDDSDSDTSTESDTTSDSEADSDDGHLEALLEKAKLSAQAKQSSKGAEAAQTTANGNGEVLLSFDDEESSKER